MKISQIRDALDFAAYHCRDLSGHTRDEFRQRDVPGLLAKQLQAINALEIAPRFVRDLERREDLIARCQSAIERWGGMQSRVNEAFQAAPSVATTLQ